MSIAPARIADRCRNNRNLRILKEIDGGIPKVELINLKLAETPLKVRKEGKNTEVSLLIFRF